MRRALDKTTSFDWDSWLFGETPIPPDSDRIVKIRFPESSAISSDFANDSTLFIGTRQLGLFMSDDGGQTWQHLWHPKRSIESLAVSPDYANDRTIFASLLKDGVFKSTDGGTTWLPAKEGLTWSGPGGFPAEQSVAFLEISPDYAQDATLFAGSVDGLYKTEDGGESWSEVPEFDGKFVVAVAVSPDYAADRTVLISVKGMGLFKSEDGGETFAPIAPVLLEDQQVLVDIEMSPAFASDQTVYGYADHLWRSTDGGETWQLLERPIRYENFKDPIRYTGDWSISANEDNSMSSVTSSGTAGDAATLDFTGSAIEWIGPKGDDHGIANVYVDGELVGVVDQYSSAIEREVMLLSVTDLEPGPHTIMIEVTGDHGVDSKGTIVSVDAFDVMGYASATRTD